MVSRECFSTFLGVDWHDIERVHWHDIELVHCMTYNLCIFHIYNLCFLVLLQLCIVLKTLSNKVLKLDFDAVGRGWRPPPGLQDVRTEPLD
jgi:hypothetical protein